VREDDWGESPVEVARIFAVDFGCALGGETALRLIRLFLK